MLFAFSCLCKFLSHIPEVSNSFFALSLKLLVLLCSDSTKICWWCTLSLMAKKLPWFSNHRVCQFAILVKITLCLCLQIPPKHCWHALLSYTHWAEIIENKHGSYLFDSHALKGLNAITVNIVVARRRARWEGAHRPQRLVSLLKRSQWITNDSHGFLVVAFSRHLFLATCIAVLLRLLRTLLSTLLSLLRRRRGRQWRWRLWLKLRHHDRLWLLASKMLLRHAEIGCWLSHWDRLRWTTRHSVSFRHHHSAMDFVIMERIK